ncbi:hypothetical protein SAMN04489841_1204 [Natrinema salaciae]|uniref:Uncharacterized protein n=1 Tax=Natrinema salaciae TaxID=1186196 RepID=A0A1H9CZT0_9EURY|nr:hypothetical protein SAMN04489841_1204 [Natrinema salaciae]
MRRPVAAGRRVRRNPTVTAIGHRVFPRWLWYESVPEVTPVGNNDDKQRAAAKCDHCGEIGIVQVRPDGSFQPLGQSDFCDCEPSALQVLETDLDHDEIP